MHVASIKLSSDAAAEFFVSVQTVKTTTGDEVNMIPETQCLQLPLITQLSSGCDGPYRIGFGTMTLLRHAIFQGSLGNRHTCATAIRLLRKKQLTKRIKRAPQTSKTRDTTQQMAGITYGNCPLGTRRINTYNVHRLHQRYVSSIQDGKCQLEKAHIRSTSVSQQFLSASFASETGPSF